MGYGSDRVYVDSLERYVDVDLPTEEWHETILEDALWFSEYGLPFDLRELPDPMYRAHLAIIRGRQDRRAEDREEADSEVKEVTRQHGNRL